MKTILISALLILLSFMLILNTVLLNTAYQCKKEAQLWHEALVSQSDIFLKWTLDGHPSGGLDFSSTYEGINEAHTYNCVDKSWDGPRGE
jgi:hypothetical protein